MNKLSFCIAAISCLLNSSMATSQRIPEPRIPRYPAGFNAVFKKGLRAVGVNVGFPAACDGELQRATNTWNSQGANFRWVYDKKNSLTTQPAQGDPLERTTIEERSWNSDNAVATTFKLWGDDIGLLDSDIVVNSRLFFFEIYYYGDVWCNAVPWAGTLPNNKFDFESVILHEFGHALGMVDKSFVTSCVMSPSLIRGAIRRTPCSQEVQSFRSAYQNKRID